MVIQLKNDKSGEKEEKYQKKKQRKRIQQSGVFQNEFPPAPLLWKLKSTFPALHIVEPCPQY